MQTIPFVPTGRYDPELIRSMSIAYTNLCRALGLSTKPDPATEIIALKIIEVAERGARTPTSLYLLAIEHLRDGK
jgi:hypothetical protein